MRRPRFTLRSADLSRHLDVFLVCGIAAVLGNRTFLIITGYPQVGNGTLHISHAIWGALMMAIALVSAVSFLPPGTRGFVAFLGGAGFGWFIDELGKFISRDTNYFFQPTIALIYVTFVAMYLVFRSLGQRAFTPAEAVLNGFEALKAASIGELDETKRESALALLDATRPRGELAGHVRALLGDLRGLPAPNPGPFTRAGQRLRALYLRFTEWPHFLSVLVGFFLLLIVSKMTTLIGFALDGPGIRRFPEWFAVVSGSVSGALMLIGVLELRSNRLRGFRWLERGLLVEILVTQVWVFAQEELAGLLGLVIALTVWVMLRSAIRAETERNLSVN